MPCFTRWLFVGMVGVGLAGCESDAEKANRLRTDAAITWGTVQRLERRPSSDSAAMDSLAQAITAHDVAVRQLNAFLAGR